MRYLTTRFLLIVIVFVFSTKIYAQTIYVPWSPDEYYDFSINDNVLVTNAGTKHVLSSARIKGIYVNYARKLGLSLSGYMRLAFDEKIMGPEYDYKTDNNNAVCHSCKGRFTAFVPYTYISRIEFKKFEIAAVYLKGTDKCIYAYMHALEISGDEDLGGFGTGTFKAELRDPGDGIVFPANTASESEIKALSSLSAVVYLKNGVQRKLSDFRPSAIALELNGGKVAIPVEKIRKIQVHEPKGGIAYSDKLLCTVQLITGEEKDFELDWSVVGSGVAGKGDRWYEAIDWNNIEKVQF